MRSAKGVVGEMNWSAFFDGGHTQSERAKQALFTVHFFFFIRKAVTFNP